MINILTERRVALCEGSEDSLQSTVRALVDLEFPAAEAASPEAPADESEEEVAGPA
jgi:hypothetical protein